MGVSNEQTAISKLEASRRQLECAIRLLFDNDDSLAVHTLAHAAFKVLFDLTHKRSGTPFIGAFANVVEIIGGWAQLSKIPNFLKHADKDADALLESHSPEATLATLGFACVLYRRLAGRMTPEMGAFHEWMRVSNPDVFELERDSDADIEAAYRESVAFLKAQPWDVRISAGKALMQLYREQLETGAGRNTAAPGS